LNVLETQDNTSYTLAAVVLIGTLEQNKRVHRRQQDDLPAHVKGEAYFKYYGAGHKDTGY